MSKIEWTQETWNPVIGCSKVSPGCQNCYAEKMACRLANIYPMSETYGEVINYSTNAWRGNTHFAESQLNKPLNRKKPTMYFVCSMGDLFHESVPFEWIDKVLDVIYQCKQHTFQILTKRPERMLKYWRHCYNEAGLKFSDTRTAIDNNIWWGVTVENQEQANKRIPLLLEIPAGIKFVSCEPLIGPIDLNNLEGPGNCSYQVLHPIKNCRDSNRQSLDWVIVGGESGNNARPVHPDWVRSLRDQCEAAKVPFFFKQWGEWGTRWFDLTTGEPRFKMFDCFLRWQQKDWVHIGDACISLEGKVCKTGGDLKESQYPVAIMSKVGKKISGSLLDGKEYKQYPNNKKYQK